VGPGRRLRTLRRAAAPNRGRFSSLRCVDDELGTGMQAPIGCRTAMAPPGMLTR